MIRVHSDIIFFSFFFGCMFCVFCCFVDNLVGFWVFLELCSLSIIPSFFCYVDFNVYSFYNSILIYIVVSSLSSVLFFVGFLWFDVYYFIYWAFALKLGLFPFSLWVYRVFDNINWVFIFLLSVVLKFPVLFFSFFFNNVCYFVVYFDCFFTLLMCAFYIWFFSLSWNYVWCHISLASVSTLVVSCFCSDFSVCCFIYFFYFFWSVFCCYYFNCVVCYLGIKGKFWLFCFLLLVTPVSLPLLYKLCVCVGVIGSSIYVLVVWVFYSFSEQLFLYKLGIDCFYSCSYNCWFG
uniref:NADH dehydrogenase subunit 2 n=1 Tax=Dipylidium caninum TaxID=66787 RepID=A0A7H9SN60_DIPCN|nr:NADH dehydrogenase subunit 2 [Dipylidium caninum]